MAAYTVKGVIESTKRPEIEHSFIKYPGQPPVDITDYKRATPTQSYPDRLLLLRALREGRKGRENRLLRTDIHTHPAHLHPADTNYTNCDAVHAWPSVGDFRYFLHYTVIRTMVIAVRSSDNGQVWGFHIFRKTKNTIMPDNMSLKIELGTFQALRSIAFHARSNQTDVVAELINYPSFLIDDRSRNKLLKAIERISPSERTSAYVVADKLLTAACSNWGILRKLIPARSYKIGQANACFVPISQQ